MHKLDRAKSMGADLTLCCELGWDGKKVARRIKALFDHVEQGLEPEIALECTGAQTSFYAAGYGQFPGASRGKQCSGRSTDNGTFPQPFDRAAS